MLLRKESNLRLLLLVAAALPAGTLGCNGLNNSGPPPPAPMTTPQVFVAPEVAGNSSDATNQLATYTFDQNGDCSIASGVPCFTQTTTSFSLTQQGTAVNNSGVFNVLDRGLQDLGTTYSYPYGSGVAVPGTVYDPPLYGSYAVELAEQAGGLVQLVGSAATPIAATSNCPSLATAQKFQFITLPSAVTTTGPGTGLTWNPLLDTAFGSFTMTSSGTAITLSDVRQFTLPLNGSAPGVPVNAAPTPLPAALCTSTAYGKTVTLPVPLAVTDPGVAQSTGAAATLAVGPSMMLVEDNGTEGGRQSYNSVLGAGTGAVGLPAPSGSLGTGPVAATEYLGFIYSTGNAANASDTGWTSNLASFGFPQNLQSSCSAFASQTGPLTNGIFGGDFPINPASGLPDPSQPAVQTNGGYGNCDLAIDLGTESPSSPGLYPAATVWIGSQFVANKTLPVSTYSFPAVAVSGKLAGKFGVMVIGLDTTSQPTQAWSVYLLQSN